jgi:hypothetical protein
MRTLRVRAVDGGWSVESDLDFGPLAFLSGAAAERQAMRLAEMLCAHGQVAQVLIHDRSGQLVAARAPRPHLRLVASYE